jgi:hypothetical protein
MGLDAFNRGNVGVLGLVLISHSHEFVFLKTKKTASTSVEEYFENLLIGEPDGGFSENSAERIMRDAYVSSRGSGKVGAKDFLPGHASSGKILRSIGDERFHSYTKVSCVRNPWDQVVSFFWWRMSLNPYLHRIVENLPMGLVRLVFTFWFYRAREKIETLSFTKRLSSGEVLPKIEIIRYENLQEDLARVTRELGLSLQEFSIPTRKSTQRGRLEPYQEYYLRPVREAIRESRSDDLANFGYSWSEIDNQK